MSILLTGGAGYIGSHTCVELLNAGLRRGRRRFNYRQRPSRRRCADVRKQHRQKDHAFYEADRARPRRPRCAAIFAKEHQIDAAIHFRRPQGRGRVGRTSRMDVLSTTIWAASTLTGRVETMAAHGVQAASCSPPPPRSTASTRFRSGARDARIRALLESLWLDQVHDRADPAATVAAARSRLCPSCCCATLIPSARIESGLIGENPNGIPNNLHALRRPGGRSASCQQLNVFGDDYRHARRHRRARLHPCGGPGASGHVLRAASYADGAHAAARRSTSAPAWATACWTSINSFERVHRREGALCDHRAPPRRRAQLLRQPRQRRRSCSNWHTEKTLDDMCRDSWALARARTPTATRPDQ